MFSFKQNRKDRTGRYKAEANVDWNRPAIEPMNLGTDISEPVTEQEDYESLRPLVYSACEAKHYLVLLKH